MLKVRVA